jgi:hypothetical protein
MGLGTLDVVDERAQEPDVLGVSDQTGFLASSRITVSSKDSSASTRPAGEAGGFVDF